MKRARLSFAPGLQIEFADRDRAIRQVLEWGERGTRYPIVVFGPEGCGKTAWLKQSAEVLRELGFEAMYVNPLHKDVIPCTDVREVAQRFMEAAAEVAGASTQLRLATLATLAVRELLTRWRKRRVAVLVDDVFQAIGLDRAEVYVKELLGLIEYPPESYENIVAVVATSEGVSRWSIGRHRWAWVMPMWNLSKRGFEELYELLRKSLGSMPSFEDAWMLTGGNPDMLSKLYQVGWNVDALIDGIGKGKRITPGFIARWRGWLEGAIEDPDALWRPEAPEELVNELIERNLIVYDMYLRRPELWIDDPPLGKAPELGIGENVAWQTPLHREAVRRALQG